MKKINYIFSKKIFALTLIAALGICGVTCARNAKEKAAQDPFFSFHEEMMKEIIASQKRMDELFVAHQKQMEKTFANLEKQGTKANSAKVLNYEDENFYYYEFEFNGFKKEEIALEIKDNVLSFSAKKSAKKEGKNHYYTTKDFYYSVSLPQYDKSINPDISRLDTKIVVKLQKIKNA